MRKNSICLIAFTFGKLPNYFDLWLKGAASNAWIDFLVYTDDHTSYQYPSNVTVQYTTFEECVQRAQKIFDFDILVPIPYKFCDFRPAFGEIFAEDLMGYEFWGTIDLDIVLGKIEHFIKPEILAKYDKILTRDHFCLYRNTPKVCAHYKSSQEAGAEIYREVFSSAKIYAFGERAPKGVYFIWKYHHWSMYDERICADILTKYNHFEVAGEPKIKRQIFEHKSTGELVRYALHKNKIIETEFMYMHLQKRKMRYLNDINNNEFYVVPNCFVNIQQSANLELEAIIRKYNGFIVFLKDYIRIIQRGYNKVKKIIYQYNGINGSTIKSERKKR